MNNINELTQRISAAEHKRIDALANVIIRHSEEWSVLVTDVAIGVDAYYTVKGFGNMSILDIAAKVFKCLLLIDYEYTSDVPLSHDDIIEQVTDIVIDVNSKEEKIHD